MNLSCFCVSSNLCYVPAGRLCQPAWCVLAELCPGTSASGPSAVPAAPLDMQAQPARGSIWAACQRSTPLPNAIGNRKPAQLADMI